MERVGQEDLEVILKNMFCTDDKPAWFVKTVLLINPNIHPHSN